MCPVHLLTLFTFALQRQAGMQIAARSRGLVRFPYENSCFYRASGNGCEDGCGLANRLIEHDTAQPE